MTGIQTVWTVIVFILFIGIAAWAFSKANKERFDKAARMALDDDQSVDETDQKS